MENILLVFLNQLERVEDFNEIIDEFDNNGYKIYLLDNIKEDEYFSFDSLPRLVESYEDEYENINKIVVLSNSRDLIFSWYRCFNSVVDNFTYFIDENDKNYFSPNDEHFDFYNNLYKFNAIDQESVEGRIYFNINFNNYDKVIGFLVENNNFRFFDCFDENYFKVGKVKKRQLLKKYIFNRYEYLFETNKALESEKIEMIKNYDGQFIANEYFLEEIVKNYYMIPYITVLFYKAGDQLFTNLLLTIFKNLKKHDKKIQKEIFDYLFEYINNKNIDFKEKIYISSLLVMINGGDERLAEFIMQTLLEDEKHLESHYEIISNIMFYFTNENLKKHNNFYIDLRNQISKLSDWIVGDKNFEIMNTEIKETNEKNKKIAIVVDQLMGLRHSPTKLMLDYAKNIKRYYPSYKIKFFVEDNLYVENKNKIIPNVYTSAISNTIKDEHYMYLDNKLIEINYSNKNKSKKAQAIKLSSDISRFNPDILLTNSDISLVHRIFYGEIPSVYMSMGGDYFSNLSDDYLCISKEKTIKENNKHGLHNEDRLHSFKYGLEFIEPENKIEKSKYNIKQNDFVMITVGNRLNAEMDKEFIDNIANFMILNENTKWLIVGAKKVVYLEDNYGDVLNNQIIRIQYEEDLAGLYKICDVYLNPRRKGGGISIAIAMNEGLPIIITRDSTDGVSYTGKDYAVNDMDEYIIYLNKLMKKRDYKEDVSKEMIKKIKKYTMKNSIDLLFNIVSLI